MVGMLTSFARALSQSEPSLSTTAAVPVAMQVCVPAPLWDWPTDSIGSCSSAFYEFCSWIPKQPTNWGPFQPSAHRLSESYQLFLSALQPPPQLDSQVAEARNALAAEANLTKVLYPNGPMKMPAWIITQSAQAFSDSNAGRPGLGETIVVDLSGNDDNSNSGQTLFSAVQRNAAKVPVRLGAGEVQKLELRADAWGDIPLHPGAWFNASLVSLLSNGPFAGPFNRDQFFGNQGILRGLLTGLRVGLNVSVVATMSDAAAAEFRKAAPAGSTIMVAGLGFAAEQVNVTEKDGITKLTLPSSAALSPSGKRVAANTPVIVGVDVASLP